MKCHAVVPAYCGCQQDTEDDQETKIDEKSHVEINKVIFLMEK